MMFDPADVEALKRRRQTHVSAPRSATSIVAGELDGSEANLRGSAGKTVQVNVRMSPEDKAFLNALATQSRTSIVVIMAEAVELLRRVYQKR